MNTSSASVYVERGPFEMVPHWVLDSEISAQALRLYLVLRRHGDNKGLCFPGRSKLAEQMHVTPSSIDRAVNELISVGALCKKVRGRKGEQWYSNLYHVHWHQGMQCEFFALLNRYTPPAGEYTPPAGAYTPPAGDERTYTHITSYPLTFKNSTVTDERINDDNKAASKALSIVPGGADTQDVEKPAYGPLIALFDTFWSAYPRKAGKGVARKAWEQAVRKEKALTIIEAAKRFRDDPNREDQFTPHPSTWLNQERWEDAPLPGKRVSGPLTAGDRRMEHYQSLYEVFGNEANNQLEGGA